MGLSHTTWLRRFPLAIMEAEPRVAQRIIMALGVFFPKQLQLILCALILDEYWRRLCCDEEAWLLAQRWSYFVKQLASRLHLRAITQQMFAQALQLVDIFVNRTD